MSALRRVSTAMSAQCGGAAGAVHLDDLVAIQATSSGQVVEGRRPHLAARRPPAGPAAAPARPSPSERRHRCAGSGRLSTLATSRIELPAAPVDGQREPPAGRPSARRKSLGEGGDVAGRRAAPAVDGLERVARPRSPGGPAPRSGSPPENSPRSMHRLGRGGVLVLVQQHHPERRPQQRRHLPAPRWPAGPRWPSGRRTRPRPRRCFSCW